MIPRKYSTFWRSILMRLYTPQLIYLVTWTWLKGYSWVELEPGTSRSSARHAIHITSAPSSQINKQCMQSSPRVKIVTRPAGLSGPWTTLNACALDIVSVHIFVVSICVITIQINKHFMKQLTSSSLKCLTTMSTKCCSVAPFPGFLATSKIPWNRPLCSSSINSYCKTRTIYNIQYTIYNIQYTIYNIQYNTKQTAACI